MDNQQNPGFQPQQPQQPMQSNTFATGQFQSAQATTPVFNAGNAIPQVGNANNPVSSATSAAVPENRQSLVYIVIIVISSLVAVTFIGLFIWMYISWSEVSTDVDGQVQKSVAIAVDENTTKLEAEFTEREKSPYKTFSSPSDYGGLSFEYPKTWSVYIAEDASGNSDYSAYLNPGAVPPVGSGDINALRVYIQTASYDEIAGSYEDAVKDGKLTVNVRQVGGTNASIYSGMIDDEYQGILALIKIRDKVATIRTDAMVFEEDFYRVLDTVSYNL